MKMSLAHTIYRLLTGEKRRTFSLALFLVILISFPLFLSSSKEEQSTQSLASATTVNNTQQHDEKKVLQAQDEVFYIYSNNNTAQTPVENGTVGWKKFSVTGANADYANTLPVYSPPFSIRFESRFTLDWFGLYGRNALDLGRYNYLTFYFQPGEPGLTYQAALINSPDGVQTNIAGVWVNFPGAPGKPGTWTPYSMPLEAFGAGNTPVHGIAFKDLSGGRANPFIASYFDEVAFSRNTLIIAGPPPLSSGNIFLPTPTDVTKPTDRIYSPQINPMVFVIPAIIIFAAMFF